MTYSEEMVSKMLDDLRAQTFVEAFSAGVEAAARLADPPLAHRVGAHGLWRQRRAKIAENIRALSCKPATDIKES